MLKDDVEKLTVEDIFSYAKTHLRFQDFDDSSDIRFNLSKIDSVANINDAFSLFEKVNKKNITERNVYAQLEQQLDLFVKNNNELDADERFRDTYNYRISAFYKLLGKYDKEREYLMKIEDKNNEFYSIKLNENLLRTEDTEKKALEFLEAKDTEDAVLYVSSYYKHKGDFEKARSVLMDYYKKYGASFFINTALAFDSIINLKQYNEGIHFLRECFYKCRYSAETALMISILYRTKSFQNHKFLKKSKKWAKIAFYLDSSSEYSVSMIVTLFMKNQPEFTEEMIDRYLELPSSKNSLFYERALMLKAKCMYINKKYSDSLAILQKLTMSEKYDYAVWNNIALCNVANKKSELAIKNLLKSVDIVNAKKDCPNKNNEKKNIYYNYIRLLADTGHYKEVVDFIEKNIGSIESLMPSVPAEYRNVIRPCIESLFWLERFSDQASLMINILDKTENLAIKNLISTDIIHFIPLILENPDLLIRKAVKILKDNYINDKKSYITNLNNIVFISLEYGLHIESRILMDFFNSSHKNEYFKATHGLYYFRKKNDIKKGTDWYNKAMNYTKDMNLYEKLKIKCRYEIAFFYLRNKNYRVAKTELQRIIKKCPKQFYWYKLKAEQLLESIKDF